MWARVPARLTVDTPAASARTSDVIADALAVSRAGVSLADAAVDLFSNWHERAEGRLAEMLASPARGAVSVAIASSTAESGPTDVAVAAPAFVAVGGPGVTAATARLPRPPLSPRRPASRRLRTKRRCTGSRTSLSVPDNDAPGAVTRSGSGAASGGASDTAADGSAAVLAASGGAADPAASVVVVSPAASGGATDSAADGSGPARVHGQRRRRVERLVIGVIVAVHGSGTRGAGSLKPQELGRLLRATNLLQRSSVVRDRRGVMDDDVGEPTGIDVRPADPVPRDGGREGHGSADRVATVSAIVM